MQRVGSLQVATIWLSGYSPLRIDDATGSDGVRRPATQRVPLERGVILRRQQPLTRDGRLQVGVEHRQVSILTDGDRAFAREQADRLGRLRRHELAGLTPTQLSALATVERAGPLRLGDVAAAEKIAPSTLTRLVTVLEERGYVERCPVPGDARASTLVVTARGHAILERIRQESTILLADSLRTLTPDQLAALAAALPALEQIADADTGDPRAR